MFDQAQARQRARGESLALGIVTARSRGQHALEPHACSVRLARITVRFAELQPGFARQPTALARERRTQGPGASPGGARRGGVALGRRELRAGKRARGAAFERPLDHRGERSQPQAAKQPGEQRERAHQGRRTRQGAQSLATAARASAASASGVPSLRST